MNFLIFILLQIMVYMVCAGIAWQWVLGLDFSIFKLFCVAIMHAFLSFTAMRAHQLTFNKKTTRAKGVKC